MLIKDLLESERATIPPGMQETMPPAMTAPRMDQYYEYYRFLVAIAGLPEKDDIPLKGPIEDGPYFAPYSAIEHDHTVELLKKMGKKVKHLTSKPSNEMIDTQKISPVRKFVDPDEDQ